MLYSGLKECPTCKETKPLAEFRTKRDYKLHGECVRCYKLRKRRKKYRKEADEKKERLEKLVVRSELQKKAQPPQVTAMIRQVRAEAAVPKLRVRRYMEKIENGEKSARTEAAVAYQQRKVDYFVELEQVIRNDATRGEVKPYIFYRSNTWLLHKHGLRYTIEPGDGPFES
jgi:Zn ribbon nucleic-acid-binding protein